MELIDTRFSELSELIGKFHTRAKGSIILASELIHKTFTDGGKLLLCGNGGSAADAQHFAAEFVNAFSRDISRPGLPAISLATDTSVLTSISNDFSFENIFSRQIEAYGKSGDLLVIFTTSGTSTNCLRAAEQAKKCGMKVIAFTRENAEIIEYVDLAIEAPSTNTQHIQECHILAYHVITEIVENLLFIKDEK